MTPTNSQANPEKKQPNLQEIRSLLLALPDKNTSAGARARLQLDAKGQSNSWGVYGDLVNWFFAHSKVKNVALNRPRLVIFSAVQETAINHIDVNAVTKTRDILDTFVTGIAPAHALCKSVDSELRVYEMDLQNPAGDITIAPALDVASGVQAMAYGMMCVEQGLDLVCLSDSVVGNDVNASAVAYTLLGGTPEDWAVIPDHSTILQSLYPLPYPENQCESNLSLSDTLPHDSLDVLVYYGGLELCAMAGAILAARMGRVPVVLDSYGACVSALALEIVKAGSTSHCVVSCPQHKVHEMVIDHLQKLCIMPQRTPYATGVSSMIAIAPLQAFVNMALS